MGKKILPLDPGNLILDYFVIFKIVVIPAPSEY